MQNAIYRIFRDEKYSLGNTVHNTVIIRYGVRWVLDSSGAITSKSYKTSNHYAVHLKLI